MGATVKIIILKTISATKIVQIILNDLLCLEKAIFFSLRI